MEISNLENIFKSVFDQQISSILEAVLNYGPRIFIAGLFFYFGLKLINKCLEFTAMLIDKSNLGEELAPFLKGTANLCLKAALFFIVAGIIGVETTKFMAVLGAAFFAIGMGLQGSLGHFAAGILIFIFRPYKVGDVVEIQGMLGIVKEIQLINTNVELFDKKMAIIPNGTAISDIVVNHSYEGIVRVDCEVSIPYNESFERVKSFLESDVQQVEKVINSPKVFVGIKSFESHSVSLSIWAFCATEDYWEVLYSVNAAIKKSFFKNKVQVAYSEGIELGAIAD